MDINHIMAMLSKDIRKTEAYQNLSPSEKRQIDNLLGSSPIPPNKKSTPKRSGRRKQSTFTYQLKVSLKGIRPPIWRRILVPGSITFHQLHTAIQAAMGWENYHLYNFELNDVLLELPDEEQDFGLFLPSFREKADSKKERLADWVPADKFKFTYTYDFGDDWEHLILVEKIEQSQEKLEHPVCLKGKRACPPEDCGGVYGYMLLTDSPGVDKDAYDIDEEYYEHYKDFDPEEFDLHQVNDDLKQLKL
ncbi:plasmid pRiA4b ORF-3 family protein [Bacillus sp. T33-2]|uniref:plasmid pRiA4b ORF-3 family protein n=1 Tax=Bacillus sp. T33-2 TaxID=2054168 RepID=UPI000C78756D|nr:plasmid pRiA4b ORF-3 family protein [Bacillus sp. T33-2]PLR95956.1 plasmid pRiA4b ORF-3 family protein [Bacillus sp. T33-2]